MCYRSSGEKFTLGLDVGPIKEPLFLARRTRYPDLDLKKQHVTGGMHITFWITSGHLFQFHDDAAQCGLPHYLIKLLGCGRARPMSSMSAPHSPSSLHPCYGWASLGGQLLGGATLGKSQLAPSNEFPR